jgi:hypothetical protein
VSIVPTATARSAARSRPSSAREPAGARIRALATDFPHVWHSPASALLERKRMLALLIEAVIRAECIAIHVRFRDGQCTSLQIERPEPIALVRKTRPDVVATLQSAARDLLRR